MPETITIRDGSARFDIRLEAVHEWHILSWRAAMKHMVQGGWLNSEAECTLRLWFPEACRDAAQEEKEAKKAYDTSYRPLKEVPKKDREAQKNLNRALYVAVREARNKSEKLKARYLEFLAASANAKKEN